MVKMTMAELNKLGYSIDASGTAKRGVSQQKNTPISPQDQHDHVPISTKAIYIPGNVPSSKNSRQLVGGDKPKSFESKLCREYRKQNKVEFIIQRKRFLEMAQGKPKPLRVVFLFARKTKQRFDYHNAVQLLFDMMTEHGWILDDNTDQAVAVPPIKPYFIDKQKPGVYISIESNEKMV